MDKTPSLDDDVSELEPSAELNAVAMVKQFSAASKQAANEDATDQTPEASPRPKKRIRKRRHKSDTNRKLPKMPEDDPSVTLSTKVANSVKKKLNRVYHQRALKSQDFAQVKDIVEEGLRLFFEKYDHT